MEGIACEAVGITAERRGDMKHWRVLGIGNESLTLWNVKQEILRLSPGCLMDLVTTFEDGQELLLMYTYDVVIADFESPVTFDLTPLIAERGFSVVAISQNGLPGHLTDVRIGSVVDPENPRETGLAVLRLLRHQNFLHLRRIFRNILMWPHRLLFYLLPKKVHVIDMHTKMLFY
jgi:hypothetical protein